MTDEQLDEIDQAMSDGAVTWYQLERLTAETRRLRELERACDVLWCERRQDGTRCMASPIIRYSKEETQQLDAAINAIGRLLEGERDETQS